MLTLMLSVYGVARTKESDIFLKIICVRNTAICTLYYIPGASINAFVKSMVSILVLNHSYLQSCATIISVASTFMCFNFFFFTSYVIE